MLVFISCVDSDRGHPSGRLAAQYRQSGVCVVTLFQNSRSLLSVFRDMNKLRRVLKTLPVDSVIVNVNGSVAQLAALIICELRRIPMSLWVMDSYPGCLRYVSKSWPMFWPIFYVAAFIVKRRVKHIFEIDESFRNHRPTSRAVVERTTYIPLPLAPSHVKRRGTREFSPNNRKIGILGNIEQAWIDRRFSLVVSKFLSKNIDVIVATSSKVQFPVVEGTEIKFIIPWRIEDTEAVFDSCDYILVPLSSQRLVYSCPSKIVESYALGLQPIIDVNEAAWESAKHRIVYRRCLHINEVLAGQTPFPGDELTAYSAHWPDGWEQVVGLTVGLSGGNHRLGNA